MTQPVPGLDDGTAKAVFFNVHMKGIKQDFAIGAADSFSKGNTFSRGVHDELFEAIDDFDAENDIIILGGFDRLSHALNGPAGKNLFVFAAQQFARPRALVDPGQYSPSHIFHRKCHFLEKRDSLLPSIWFLSLQALIGRNSD